MGKTSKALRRYIIGGLLFWLPIWVTFIVLRFLFQLFDGALDLLPTQYQPSQLFGFNIPGLGIVLTVAILLLTGLIFTNILGSHIINVWEKLLERIPLVRTIYSAVKQVTQTLFQPDGTSFRKVVLVEYPRKGIWSIGFLTSDQFQHTTIDNDSIMVFIPTTPNPTSGFLTIVAKKDARELDISVEEGLRMVISLGVVMPGKFNKLIGNQG